MSENALLTAGITLKRGDGGSPETFVIVPDMTAISGPTGSKPRTRVTDFQSTAEQYKPGLPDFGEITVEINYIPSNAVHAAIFANFNTPNPVTGNWQRTFTDGKTWTFPGYVAGFVSSPDLGGVEKATFTLQVTNSIVET